MAKGRDRFGFFNFVSKIFRMKVRKDIPGKFAAPGGGQRMHNFAVREVNRALRLAVKKAKSPGHSPYKTGMLVRSIGYTPARSSGASGLTEGAITVGVPYGRRLEFEHATRAFYLKRALEHVMPEFRRRMLDKGRQGDIILGGRGDDRGLFV